MRGERSAGGWPSLKRLKLNRTGSVGRKATRPGKYSLGPWVTSQRYCKDNLSAQRKRRLDSIGFVWNWRDYLWERGFISLLQFKRREGHCHVPIFHREGTYRLGSWVSTQRRNRNELPAERKARLNKIGFVWKEVKGALSHRAARRCPCRNHGLTGSQRVKSLSWN
jgi:Helicase associated domain